VATEEVYISVSSATLQGIVSHQVVDNVPTDLRILHATTK